ncbi:MAG: S-layer homology domain-containing protein [Eubacteriales bacterium]|nr:S-layer homology domain-containing protein [Eubacteriales bacterium]
MKRLLLWILTFAVAVSPLSITARAVSVSDFSDVKPGAWYYESVSYVVEQEMFNGTSDSTFSPQSTMTRAMFVTVLGRHAGISTALSNGIGTITASNVNMRTAPTTSSAVECVLTRAAEVTVLAVDGDWYRVRYGSHTGWVRNDLISVRDEKYTDTAYNKWYSPYVSWAGETGVASAEGSLFHPDRAITRAEICAMLYNYAALKDAMLPALSAPFVFSDDANIDEDVREAVYALQSANVITGYEDNSFRPEGSATRAEVSAMLMRFFSVTTFAPPATSEDPFDHGSVPDSDVPGGTTVDESWFDDACFIGHSIVVGMKTFFGLKNAAYYAVTGISAPGILKYDDFTLQSTHEDEDGKEVHDTGTLEDVLEEQPFGKVYIMLGTNELGSEPYHVTSYQNSMNEIVDLVQRTQPDARIYLISTPPVTQTISETENSRFTRENVIAFNQALKSVATEQGVFYLDVFSLLSNSQGYLPEESATYDGIHLLAAQYAVIKDYLRSHT